MDPPQPSIDLDTKKGDEITEVKQGVPGEPIAKLETDKKNEPVNAEVKRTAEENMDHVRYAPLYRAVLENDRKAVDHFISKHPEVLTAKIKVYPVETGIHIISRNLDAPIWLWEKIALMVRPESLEQSEYEYGQPAIFIAVFNGNMKAAEALVRRNNNLPNTRDSFGLLPIHVGALCGHEGLTQYLLSVTKVRLDDEKDVELLGSLVNSGFCGIALDILKRYPKLAREKSDRGTILSRLANKPRAFESGLQLEFWERLIYNWIPVQSENIPHPQSVDEDIENAIERSKKLKKLTFPGSIDLRKISTVFGALSQKLYIIFWNALIHLVPTFKCIRDKKLMHMQTLEIVRIMCHEGVNWSNEEAKMSLQGPVLTATRLGIHELVNEIMRAYFFSFTFRANEGAIFRLAALHRHDKVFSLVNRKEILLCWDEEMKKPVNVNKKANNLLHLVGKFVPSHRIPGAALQMQRELQWFKAVESSVHPSLQEQRNEENKTAREVFTEEHKDLVEKGEKWMKETATSCTIVAALIITVVFAAALTVPGGNDCTEGMPVFLHKPSFIVFVVSDALALFSSTASVLMFLGILTSRYSDEDFLVSLPNKLIIGLITLFFSIASMMVAFGATIYIFLSHPWKWTIIPISLLGCLPVTLFAMLQFPLLVAIYSSTYGTSIIQTRKW